MATDSTAPDIIRNVTFESNKAVGNPADPTRDEFDFGGNGSGSGRFGQLERLHDMGLRVAVLNTMRDVDTIADAQAVARVAPDTEFARVLVAQGHGAP